MRMPDSGSKSLPCASTHPDTTTPGWALAQARASTEYARAHQCAGPRSFLEISFQVPGGSSSSCSPETRKRTTSPRQGDQRFVVGMAAMLPDGSGVVLAVHGRGSPMTFLLPSG